MARALGDWQDLFGIPVAMSVRKTDAANNDRSVADTVALMGVHANNASRTKHIAEACNIAGINTGDSPDGPQQVREKIFRFIKANIRFVQDEDHLVKLFYDPQSKELLITPPVLLEMNDPSGDCDDFSMLCASMLLACGLNASFVTVAADERMPDLFSHVYVISNGVPMDCSHGGQVGWETSKAFRKQIWPIIPTGGKMATVNVRSQSNWLSSALRGIGLGDCEDGFDTDTGLACGVVPPSCLYGMDASGNCLPAPGAPTIPTLPNTGGVITTTPSGVVSTPVAASSGGINWNNILPGLFASTEKIAQQISQPAGYQITNPNGQTVSYVAPAGATTVPAISSLLTGTTTLGGAQVPNVGMILIVVGILFAVSQANKG